MQMLTDGTNRLVEDGFQALLRQCGAFQVLDCSYVFGHGNTLRISDGLHASVPNNSVRQGNE